MQMIRSMMYTRGHRAPPSRKKSRGLAREEKVGKELFVRNWVKLSIGRGTGKKNESIIEGRFSEGHSGGGGLRQNERRKRTNRGSREVDAWRGATEQRMRKKTASSD